MKKILASFPLAMLLLPLWAATRPTPPADWDAWFKKNVMASDKKGYVHLFWNAQDVRKRFEGRDRVPMLARAAVELIRRKYPEKAGADLVKIDIVYVKERDEYGMPKWSTLQRAAHIEGSKKALTVLAEKDYRADDKAVQALFQKFTLY